MQTAVAIVFFNRIEPLRKLVARLAEIKPPRVYLISDGARATRQGESERVMVCREFMQKLPWECEIQNNFAEQNMGCRARVTSGLDWVFEREDQVVVLEDDCVPELEFFPWVEKMLDRYRNERQVFSVSGTNLCPHVCVQTEDCTFSKYAMYWGWATWRRAWAKNDKDLSFFDYACQIHLFKNWLGSWRTEWYWRYLLTHVKNSWGYRWSFTHFVNNAYCVVPPVNLVENIGMTDVEATHTSRNPYQLASVEKKWRQPVSGPMQLKGNDALDQWIDDHFYSRSLGERMRWLVKKIWR